MRPGKKFGIKLLPVFLCLLSMLLVACGGSSGGTSGNGNGSGPAAAPDDKQVLRLPNGLATTDFDTLDPALVSSAADAYAIQAMFTGLVQFNDKGEVIDQLAASHQISSDGLTYTFKLKPNLKFSDGSPLTAKDVIYSMNRSIDPATKSEVSYYLNLVKGFDDFQGKKVSTLIGSSLQAPDDNTVVITLGTPGAYFLQALTYPTSYPVEKKLIDQYSTKWTEHLTEGGGDGPFKMSNWDHSRMAELVPNSNYYGPQPKIKKLQFFISGDTATTYKAYQNGQYDQATVPSAELADAKTHSDYHNAPVLIETYISMNFLAKPFDNLKIRQAFALALDKDLLIKTVYRGSVIPTNHIVPKGMVGYYDNLTGPLGVTGVNGDKTKAADLLKQGLSEAGFSSASALPSLTMAYGSGNPTRKDLVSAIASQWKTVLGVDVKLATYTRGQLTKLEGATKGKAIGPQLWFDGWQADYPDPQDWLSTFFNKGADYNNNNFGQTAEEQAIQAEMAKADVNLDKTSRIQQYNDAEQKIINDVGWIPMYQSQNHVRTNPKLQNYTLNALNITAPDDWGNIYFTQ